MNIQDALKKVGAKQDLSAEEMLAVMRQIMTGQLTQAQIGGFLVGLRMKGESIEEITAAASVMRELVSKVEISVPNLLDVVGTGGDGSSSFNVSTASAFVAVAAGAHVAKHGNRAASGKCGSADLLEHAGARIDLTPEQIAKCVVKTGFGFMLAPAHHNAMKHAIGARRELGIRTIFNALGPLTNPALVKRELMGVFSHDLVEPLAQVMQKLGAEHVMIVHSEDGLDEISISTPTYAAELKDDEVQTFTIDPQQYGILPGQMEDVVVNDPGQSLAMIRSVFSGDRSAAGEMTTINGAAAIYISGIAAEMGSAVKMARDAISSGAAMSKFEEYIRFTNSF